MLRPVCHLVSGSAGGEEWVVGCRAEGVEQACCGQGIPCSHAHPPNYREGMI